MKHAISTAIAALLLAACSSTPPSPEGNAITIQALSDEVFSADGEAGLVHMASGLACAASIGGYTFDEETLFEADGTDVACGYKGEGTNALTLYFISSTRVALAQEAENSAAVIPMISRTQLDEQASENCVIGLTFAAATGGGTDTSALPCYIFRNSQVTSILALRETDGWITKVRLTEQTEEGEVPDEMFEVLLSALRLRDQ